MNRLVRIGIPLLIGLLLPAAVAAQKQCEPCFELLHFTLDAAPGTRVQSDHYAATVTMGVEVELTANDFSEYSVATGFWGHYLTEPQPPRVTATDGDHLDRVELKWEIVDDRTGPPVTDENVLIYRNGTVLTTLPLDQTEYQDFNVFPGEEYEYAVVPGNKLGKSHQIEEGGFLNPNGTIIGTIETRNGNPVPDVKVVLTPNLGRSAYMEVDDYVYFPEMLEGLEGAYTLEGWFRSIDSGDQTLFAVVDSATAQPFVRVQLTDGGRLRWEHRGAGSEQSDLVTTPVSYTDDSEWHHFAAVLDTTDMGMILYVDGRIVAHGTAGEKIGQQKAQLVFGKLGANQNEQYFQGRLDDWRLWDRARTRPEIRRDLDRTLEGDEEGLMAYWKFDEVKGETLFDLTRNDQDGILCGIERSEFIAPVFVSGVTDENGNYAIRNIFYGTGTTFTATPQKHTPIGRSLKFDGVDDYIAFQFDRLDLTGGYTAEGWFKHPGANGPVTLFSAVAPLNGANHANVTLLDDGRLQFGHLGSLVTSTEGYDNEFWYHFAATFDGATGSLALYVDGVEVGAGSGTAIDEASAFVLGRQAPETASRHYLGWLDEIRVWDRARNLEQINAVRNQVLKGDETGMIAYWKINEGDGLLVTDATAADHTGEILGGAQWTDDIPLNEVFTHTFDPESRQVILNPGNTTVDRVEFTDISQIAVAGFFKYSGTTCFIQGAEILVNGESLLPPIFTDENGRFIAEFEPGAKGQQISVSYREHDIAPGFIELPRITVPITGLFFEDIVKREIGGKVVGGACSFPITPSQGQLEVTARSVDGCIEETVVPHVDNGTYTIKDLPPINYQLSVAHPNPEIDAFFAAENLSLEQESQTFDFVYRAAPEVVVSGFPVTSCGLPVVDQLQRLNIDIDIVETYVSQGTANSCPAADGLLVIRDNISDRNEPIELEFENGSAVYQIRGGDPNILAGGDHPYQKNIQVTATDDLDRNATVEEWVYVTGQRPRQTAFATTSPEIPLMIVRAPPGDGSYAFWSKETTVEQTIGFSMNKGLGTESFFDVHLGPDIEFEVGIGYAQTTEIDVTMDLSTSTSINVNQASSREQTWTFSTEETISTTAGGDVYVGGAMNILYGITDVLEIDDSTCGVSVRPDIIIAPDGFATHYVYSELFITSNVIPGLEAIGDVKAADLWRGFIARNNRLKERATFSRNISFDAGTEFEFSETTEVTESSTVEFEVELDQAVAIEAGVTVNGLGATGGVRVSTQMSTGKSQTTTRTSANTFGFLLADNDQGDAFTVNVLKDPVYGSPVFQTVSGFSSCPWEPDTVPRDGAQIQISPPQQIDVPPDELATYTLNLGNISQTDEERNYELRVLNESNPDGAVMAVNGVILEGGLNFFIPAGQQVEAELTVGRGQSNYFFDDLELLVVSPCEFELGTHKPIVSSFREARLSGETPPREGRFRLADVGLVSAHFQVPCSEINIALPEENWLITAADQTTELAITLDGYDRLDENLEELVLQYRPASGGDWFNAFSVPKAELREDFVLRSWDISPAVVPDGEYELRAAALCGLGLVPGTSITVKGRIDREPPRPLGLPEPSDGILHPDDQISIRFNEDINCGAINIGAGHILLTNSVTGQDVDFNHTCGGNEVLIDPNVQNLFLENLTLRASVGPVEDLFGNQQTEGREWEFFVNRNPIEWAGLDVRNIVIFEDQSFATTRTLVNNGGSSRSFDITDIPSWLQVEPREGTILPGEATTVAFSVDGNTVGAGAFKKTVFASGTQGNEPRLVDVRVLCHPPDWGEVNPADFRHSMTITADLTTDGVLSDDVYDRVGVFVDGELRGLDNVEFIQEFEGLANTHPHKIFLTVYGNAETIGKDLEFRVWDASACSELGLVLEDYQFSSNANHGTPTNPAPLTATSQIIGTVPLPAGWTWFSLNLLADDMSTNAVLSTLTPGTRDILRGQSHFSQFVEGAGWVGSQSTLGNESMYLINLAEVDTLEMIGFAVDVEKTHIPIKKGWNWIGFLPQQSLAVNRALESLNSVTGDIIKNQFEFAQFVEGVGWVGNLKFLNPKLGYQLFAQEAGTLSYPFFEGDPAAKTPPLPAALIGPLDWRLDPRRYPQNMAVVAAIGGDGVQLEGEADVVAAFIGDEVRGVGHTVYLPDRDRYLAFLLVYGDETEDGPVSFRFFDGGEEVERFIPMEVEFRGNDVLGQVHAPFVLETRERRIGDRGFVPKSFMLSQSFPNPFNPTTQIGYGLPRQAEVEIAIYNLLGQRIRTLVTGTQKAGYHYVTWNGRNGNGHPVPSGMYFYVMESGSFRDVKKVMLLK